MIEGLAERIRAKWVYGYGYLPYVPDIITAASLAHHRFLRSVQWMCLKNVDLASVPSEHLASLISGMTGFLFINNVSNFDLINILDNLKCEWLFISRQTLSSEETRALVRAMESGVELVELGRRGEVTLDIRVLTQYSGHEMCQEVSCWDDTAEKYREELSSYSQRINWENLMSPIHITQERLNLRIKRI